MKLRLHPKVWEMLAWDRTPEWIGIESDTIGPKNVECTSEVRTPEDKYKVCATAHITGKHGEEFVFEITESIENEKMTTRSTSGNWTLFGTYSLKATEAGTEVTNVVDYEMPYSILGKIIDKLVVGRKVEKEVDM